MPREIVEECVAVSDREAWPVADAPAFMISGPSA